MKIHISTVSGSCGRGYFFDRLSRALVELGENVTRNPRESSDVSLQAIFVYSNNAKYTVLRLDGVHHNVLKDYKRVNTSIVERGVKNADAIVYQSEFSRKMCNKYLGKFEGRTTVIYNGADPKFYEKVKSARSKTKHSILASARWRPHKRLKHIVESFLLADMKKTTLFIAGDTSGCGMTQRKLQKIFFHPNIEYLGNLPHNSLAPYLKVVDSFVHLCWFDNCPNGVVEAIVAGVPVITNNVGGTHEIVKPSGGFVLPIDDEYDLEPCRLYEPPEVDKHLVIEAMKKCCLRTIKVDSSHVNINNIAKQYRDFFRKVGA